MSQPARTIAALSSGSLPSGVAVIRISGPDCLAAVEAISGTLPQARRLALRVLSDPATGEPLDRGLVAIFPAPDSFTGEDCAELQVHGSPAGVKAVLSVLTQRPDIRLAQAGEFTRRAFENDKLDLTAIEGLGDLLAAETEQQRRQALSRLEGNLRDQVILWRAGLVAARAEIEAHLDFSDEDDVPFALPDHFAADLSQLASSLGATLAGFERGRVTREGFRVVLAGAPNAGKSSLLNALAGSELAIVTAEAGTTRDTKDVTIDLGGTLVILTDTAGLRETDSIAEAEGVRRARLAIERADLVLWLSAPDVEDVGFGFTPHIPIWRVATKTDLGAAPGQDLALSAKTGSGIADLLNRLQSHIDGQFGAGEPSLVSHLRDQEAIGAAKDHLEAALGHIDQPELCAEDLRAASDRLAGLVGLIDSEDVLDRLFAGFCIGK